MTGQPNSRQILFADIQTALDRTQPPPWAVYQQWLEQRQLLLRVKELWHLLQDRSLNPTTDPTSQTTLAAISQDLTQLRGNLLLPLQQEIQDLMQQRDALKAEVATLAIQAQNLQQITSSPEITASNLGNEQLDLFALQSTHDRATQLFSQLDRTIQMTFNSLDQDVETYRLALARQLEQLYDLGQRSESVIATLLQQVIDETQQATQQYLQAHPPAAIAPPRFTPISATPVPPTLTASIPAQPPAAENVIATLDELLPQIGYSPPINPPSTPNRQSINPEPNATDFTLIGLDDLFASVPPPTLPAPSGDPPSPPAESPRDFTDTPPKFRLP